MQRDLERVYEIGEFQQAAFELERQDEQTILVIRLEEKYWGPNYLRLGLFLASNFEGNGDYGLLGQITRSGVEER